MGDGSDGHYGRGESARYGVTAGGKCAVCVCGLCVR